MYAGCCECLVKAGRSKKAICLTVLFGFLCVLMLLCMYLYMLSWFGTLAGPLAVVCGVLTWIWGHRIGREYEYTAGDGRLQIDVIYGKNRRKNVLEIPFDTIQLLAPEDRGATAVWGRKAPQRLDYAGAENRVYELVAAGGERVLLCRFSPDDRMLAYLRKYLSRGIMAE